MVDDQRPLIAANIFIWMMNSVSSIPKRSEVKGQRNALIPHGQMEIHFKTSLQFILGQVSRKYIAIVPWFPSEKAWTGIEV